MGLYEVCGHLGRSWKDRRPWFGRGRDVLVQDEGCERLQMRTFAIIPLLETKY